jgi:hypothetical protein
VITAERNNHTLTLRQRRFTYLPNDAAQTWMVPVTITAYAPTTRRIPKPSCWKKQTDVTLPPETTAYKINTGQTGFYHVCYNDAENLTRLGAMVARQQLPPMDRWGLQNDLFALVKSGLVPWRHFWTWLKTFACESAYLPLSSLDSHLFEAFLVLRGEDPDPDGPHRHDLDERGPGRHRAICRRRMNRRPRPCCATSSLSTAP